MAAQLLVEWGHEVTLHARNAARVADARRALPQARAIVTGDLSRIADMRAVADEVNALGHHDAVIHNVGVGYREPRRIKTADGKLYAYSATATDGTQIVYGILPFDVNLLDINTAWVNFSHWDLPYGAPATGPTTTNGTLLTYDQNTSPTRYFSTLSRDFFTMSVRPVSTPSAPSHLGKK